MAGVTNVRLRATVAPGQAVAAQMVNWDGGLSPFCLAGRQAFLLAYVSIKPQALVAAAQLFDLRLVQPTTDSGPASRWTFRGGMAGNVLYGFEDGILFSTDFQVVSGGLSQDTAVVDLWGNVLPLSTLPGPPVDLVASVKPGQSAKRTVHCAVRSLAVRSQPQRAIGGNKGVSVEECRGESAKKEVVPRSKAAACSEGGVLTDRVTAPANHHILRPSTVAPSAAAPSPARSLPSPSCLVLWDGRLPVFAGSSCVQLSGARSAAAVPLPPRWSEVRGMKCGLCRTAAMARAPATCRCREATPLGQEGRPPALPFSHHHVAHGRSHRRLLLRWPHSTATPDSEQRQSQHHGGGNRERLSGKDRLIMTLDASPTP
jgi:hypothetical protein